MDQRRVMLPLILDMVEAYSTEFVKRGDARLPSDLRRLLRQLESGATDDLRLAQIEKLAREFAQVYDTNNRMQVSRQIEVLSESGVIQGILLGAMGTKARRQLRKYIRQNVRLIKSLGRDSKEQVAEVVREAFIDRIGPETLEQRLIERVRVAESRAKLIARDQGNKFFGSLTRARHEDIGAYKYEWSSSADERVRPTHRDYNGRVFRYSQPPPEGNPGEPIQCRCTGIPRFD